MTDRRTPEQNGANQQMSRLERLSAPWLIRLQHVPRWLFMVVIGVVLLVGVALENPVGGVLLLLLALFLGWLAAVGWRYVSPVGRAVRLVVIGGLIVIGVSFFV